MATTADPARTPDAPDGARSSEKMGLKVVHELKNSLTAVKALVQLGSHNPAEAASHDRLALVERELTRMQLTLQRYLSSGRPLEEIRPARIDLGLLVADTLLLLSGRANDARVRLLSHGRAVVEADPRRLTEALVNLVSNGIEATPPGGAVIVSVHAHTHHAEIVVRDTGRGMPAETLRRLGTPFFTTREGGTGLGVLLARAVIALHGGALHYESDPGKGTTVRATLPSRAKAAAQS
jgi:two-component system, NtrC family, sensor histidine kinase HydH